MYIDLNNEAIYVATGGKTFDNTLPTVVFVHGSGLDHRSWALQTRWFAFHGFSVLAPDFPAHSLSKGTALNSIEAMSVWLWDLLDELDVKNCSFVGHSQGGLVALECAANQPERTRSISLIGCAAAIPVNEQLLQMAKTNQPAAVDAMLTWGFGEAYQFGRSHIPGQAPLAIGSRIMNNNPLAADLEACQNYINGEQAAQKITAPAQLILSTQDKMTPIKIGRALNQLLPNVQASNEVTTAGHMLPIEAPDTCLKHLQSFIQAVEVNHG